MSIDPNARRPLTVAITGASGMIGTALSERLRLHGDSVRRVVRASSQRQPGDIVWDPRAGVLSPDDLEGCDAIVNLAGEPVAQRWNDARKREIRDSRVQGASLIARAVASMASKPRVVLSGSATGYYGNGGEKPMDESSASGEGFLASVTREWEASARPIADAGVRLVLLRTGIVLSPKGGALKELLTPFKLGAGGPIDGGKQWMSWISLDDHVSAMLHLLRDEAVDGAVNLVAPAPVRNGEFAHTLGSVLHRPSVVPIPGFALELMFGEMAVETILWGQKVVPRKLEAAGFSFAHPSLRDALLSMLA